MDNELPYLMKEIIIKTIERRYNPKYGDDKTCICGHSYYRHFDPWEDMYPVGCKYCSCSNFIPL